MLLVTRSAAVVAGMYFISFHSAHAAVLTAVTLLLLYLQPLCLCDHHPLVFWLVCELVSMHGLEDGAAGAAGAAGGEGAGQAGGHCQV